MPQSPQSKTAARLADAVFIAVPAMMSLFMAIALAIG